MFNKINISILGMGYVGLPLAVEAGKYYPTVGFDINKFKIGKLKKNIDLNNELKKTDIKKSRLLKFTSNTDDLSNCNFYIICVPTPINKNKKPDLSLLKSAAVIISKLIKKGDIVVFESTVYPGVTEKICKEVIEKNSGIKFISNNRTNGFYAGYSPERLNPGEKNRKIYQITKIVSGSNNYSKKIITRVYSKIQKNNVYVANSIKIAEAAKVIENVQRDVNIALINEFAKIFDKSNIDIFDVLNAASTKWNFHKYYPGLVGGHCIGVDPYYLSYFSKKQSINPLMITSGRRINDQMSNYLVKKILYYLKKNDLNKPNIKLLIMGYTFKKNCSDIRNTQIEKVFKLLNKSFKNINIYDPYVDKNLLDLKLKKKLINYPKTNYYDSIIIPVDHNIFKKLGKKNILKFLNNNKKLIFDLNNLFKSKDFIHF